MIFRLTWSFMSMILQGTPPEPIVVKIVEPKQKTLADVVLGAVGLTGILVAIAVVFALAFAALLFLARSRDPLRNASEGAEHPSP